MIWHLFSEKPEQVSRDVRKILQGVTVCDNKTQSLRFILRRVVCQTDGERVLPAPIGREFVSAVREGLLSARELRGICEGLLSDWKQYLPVG